MKKIEYKVLNLDCAGCAGKIQHKATTMQGISSAEINLYNKNFILETDEYFNEDDFLQTINKYADSIEPGTKIVAIDNNKEDINSSLEDENDEKKEKMMIIVGLIVFLASFVAGIYSTNLKIILSIIAYLILGLDVITNSIKNMTKGNFMDENFLMTIATLGAFYLNETAEAVGVMLFYKIGEYFQDKAVSNSRKSIKKLLDIRPEYANIKNKNGELIQVSPKDLNIGDRILLKLEKKFLLTE